MPSGVMPGTKYIVYVEDRVTQIYLSNLQPNRSLVQFIIVGGRNRVLGCLEDDFRNNVELTLGVTDRDFDRNAKLGWCITDVGREYYCLPAHEIENYLLDFEAIESFRCPGVNPQKPASHWLEIAKKIASGYLYSVVYNQVLSDLQREYSKNYPRHLPLSCGPGADYGIMLNAVNIETETELVVKLLGETWFAHAAQRFESLFSSESLKERVSQAVEYYKSILDRKGYDWVYAFPGKEMYKAIANSMSLTDSYSEDLTKYIARTQMANNTVPSDIQDLLTKFT